MSTLESSRPRDTDRKTRVHLSFYDRTKFLLFFSIVFLVLVWADMAGDDSLTFEKALSIALINVGGFSHSLQLKLYGRLTFLSRNLLLLITGFGSGTLDLSIV